MSESGSPPVNKKPRSSLENFQELILKAIQDGNYEELDLLLKPGVKLDPEWFMIAHAKHGWKMVKILLENDPSGVFAKNKNGETLLMLNINDIEAARYLIDHGANIFEYFLDDDGEIGESVLLHATTEYFLDDSEIGESVLLHALKENPPNIEIIDLLLMKGAINSSENAGYIAKEALEVAVLHPQANVEIIRLIFKYGPALSEYQYTQYDGQTALFHALTHSQPNLEIIRVLVENGADVNQLINEADTFNTSRYASENALLLAVKRPRSYKKEILQYFIEEIGMDPFTLDTANRNVFCNAFEMYVSLLYQKLNLRFIYGEINDTPLDPFGEKMTKFREEKTEALEYLLRLPQFQLYQDEHPQTIYLSQWFTIPMFEMPEILLSPEFKQTNLITRGFYHLLYPAFITRQFVNGRRFDCLFDLRATIYLSPISLCINSLVHYSADIQKYILKFLESLVENGFRVDEPGSISPLTLVLSKYMDGILKVNSEENTIFKFVTLGGKVGEEVKSELVEVIQFLIKKGAHVGQSIVPFPVPANAEFETLRQNLFLPDAVYAAFESGCFFCLPLVLPYFAQPPLTLLLLTKPVWTDLVNSMFPILCKGGPIPPGSRYLNDLIAHLQRMNAELKIDHVYNKFLEMHSSPPTLMHLSRCAIRRLYAERASQPGESLPKLMRSFEIPVELKDYLEMPPHKRLDAFYCEDPIMARIANKGVRQLEPERSDDSEDESDDE